MGARVFFISDKVEAGQVWSSLLQLRGLDVTVAAHPQVVLDRWGQEIPDLLVIDCYGDQMDAIGLCRKLRAEATNPILLLTCGVSESSQLEAYAAGVDECVVKPIGPLLFLAKVQALLRRSWTVPTDLLIPIEVGGLRLEPRLRQVHCDDGCDVKLTNLEFRLLHALMSHPNQLLEQDFLISHMWGSSSGDPVMLKNVVYRMRKKLQVAPAQFRIRTIPHQGYSLETR